MNFLPTSCTRHGTIQRTLLSTCLTFFVFFLRCNLLVFKTFYNNAWQIWRQNALLIKQYAEKFWSVQKCCILILHKLNFSNENTLCKKHTFFCAYIWAILSNIQCFDNFKLAHIVRAILGDSTLCTVTTKYELIFSKSFWPHKSL